MRWVSVAVFTVLLASGSAHPGDPVLDLAKALDEPAENADDLKARDAKLTKQIERFRDVGDLYRALNLNWNDSPHDASRDVDRRLRAEIERRLIEKLRGLLESNDRACQLAAITLIGELGTSIRSTYEKDEGDRPVMRLLAPELAKLTRDGPTEVRLAAARSLATIFADSTITVPALTDLFKSQEPELRRGSAEALHRLIGAVRTSRSVWSYQGSPQDALRASAIIAPPAALALSDNDVQVRRLCAKVLEEASHTLNDHLATPETPREWRPHPQEKPEEQARINKELADAMMVLVQSLTAQVPAIIKALADADAKVRMTSMQALETLADARVHLVKKSSTRVGVGDQQEGLNKVTDSFRQALRMSVPAVATQLANGEVREKLAALYVLESLQADAIAALEAVTIALRHNDPFVRWGAARVFGNAVSTDAPPAPELSAALDKAAPDLARLLSDENRDIRLTAASALERFGPAARSAARAVADVVTKGDPETKMLATKVLAAMGPAVKPESVPTLVKALDNTEPSVRAAAANALRVFAPLDAVTANALQNILGDANADVRKAAADALLAGK